MASQRLEKKMVRETTSRRLGDLIYKISDINILQLNAPANVSDFLLNVLKKLLNVLSTFREYFRLF